VTQVTKSRVIITFCKCKCKNVPLHPFFYRHNAINSYWRDRRYSYTHSWHQH